MKDNFEIHDRATELSDTMAPYALARRVVELEEKLQAIRGIVQQLKKEIGDQE
jgi:hypothetical protein